MIFKIYNKLKNDFYKFYFRIYYYKEYKRLKNKIDFILQYNEKNLNLSQYDQEEQALPGFTKYKKNNWYRYMFGRYIFSLKYIQTKNVIDTACGAGWGSYLISDFPSSIDSIDINDNALNFAKKTWDSNKLNFMSHSILEIDKLNKEYDVVLSYEVIEHLKYDDGVIYLQQISKSLSQNGYLIMSSYFPLLKKDALKEMKKNKYHLYIYTKKEIIKLLKDNGFRNVKFYGDLIIRAQK